LGTSYGVGKKKRSLTRQKARKELVGKGKRRACQEEVKLLKKKATRPGEIRRERRAHKRRGGGVGGGGGGKLG